MTMQLKANWPAVVSAFETEMVVQRPYPEVLRELVFEVVARWSEFCALPEEVKLRFGYTNDVLISGAGYELKRDPSTGHDFKEDFHVRLDCEAFLRGEAHKVGAAEAHRFLDAAFAVYPELDLHITRVLTEIEEAYRLPGLVDGARQWNQGRILRLLHYFGGCAPGGILGKPHPDKGGFTAHLYESDPGVERLTWNGEWVPMDVHKGEALFFSGLGLQHRSRCAIRAPWHRIVANEKTASTGRVSAVCFSSFAEGRYYDKARWGSTQTLPVGESYRQTFAEFDQLFRDP